MTADDLMRYIIGVQSQNTGPNVPEYVTEFYQAVKDTVKEERARYEEMFDISLASAQYELPYNYIFGKISNLPDDTEIDEAYIERLRDLSIRKARFDVMTFARDSVRVKAYDDGDSDLTI